jgi:hypothetical protein
MPVVERFTIKLKMIGYIVKIVDDISKNQHALISTTRRRHWETQRVGYIQNRKRCKSVSSVYRCNPQVACNTGVQMDNNLYKSCNRRFHSTELFTMDPQPIRRFTCTTMTITTMWLPAWLRSWVVTTSVQTATKVITPKKNTRIDVGVLPVADLEGACGACAPPKIRKAYVIQR